MSGWLKWLAVVLALVVLNGVLALVLPNTTLAFVLYLAYCVTGGLLVSSWAYARWVAR